MITYERHIVTGPGMSSPMHFDDLRQAQAKASAVGGEVKSHRATSLRQLRRKVSGREGMPSRQVRRAHGRLSSATGGYNGKESQTKPGAMRHW